VIPCVGLAMKLSGIAKSPWTKFIWWLLVVIFMTTLMAQRYGALLAGMATTTDAVIFLIWISLLLAPLFREVSIFGVSLRKEIDSLRTETREQILNLRTDVQNSIHLQAEINPQINVYQALPEETLSSIKKQIQAERPQKVPEKIEVPEFTQFAFSTRYTILKELDRILSGLKLDVWTSSIPLRGVHSALLFLKRQGLITEQVYNALETVIMICNKVIHGREPSEVEVQFVKDVAPSLIAKLTTIKLG